MKLVENHRSIYGLNRCLKALRLSKGTWHYRRHSEPERRTKEEALKEWIVKVIEENPGYGYGASGGSWLNTLENRLTTRGLGRC
jgi:hypothetical protein